MPNCLNWLEDAKDLSESKTKRVDWNLKLKQAQSSILTKLGQERKKREEEKRIYQTMGQNGVGWNLKLKQAQLSILKN